MTFDYLYPYALDPCYYFVPPFNTMCAPRFVLFSFMIFFLIIQILSIFHRYHVSLFIYFHIFVQIYSHKLLYEILDRSRNQETKKDSTARIQRCDQGTNPRDVSKMLFTMRFSYDQGVGFYLLKLVDSKCKKIIYIFVSIKCC